MSDTTDHQRTVHSEQPGPPRLVVVYANTRTEYLLTEPFITLGRANDNHIVIPLPPVSRLHAVLTSTDEGHTITDQRSVNGLYYQGRQIMERLLRDGDILRISDELGNVATLTYQNTAQAPISQVLFVAPAAQRQELSIGRAADNLLVLNHPQVSEHHALIRRDEYGARLIDLTSTNGTFVHGQRITSIRLQRGDVFRIASYQLIYEPNSITDSVTPQEAVRLDALNLGTSVRDGTLLLLRDVSLSIAPKELVAIVGGSGTGKSTLLGALNGFQPATSGEVLINGQPLYKHFDAYRRQIGFVPQDDLIHLELTVEQTLFYAARLRFGSTLSPSAREQRLGEVLTDVNLNAYRQARVAHLSGGLRKRVSVAVELLARPALLFLDEPTTGLDPGLDKRIMSMLRMLADRGCTITLVTHATANIAMCDRVAILGRGGRLCFYGPPHQALAFFEVDDFSDIYGNLSATDESALEWEGRFKQSPAYDYYIQQPLNNRYNIALSAVLGEELVQRASAETTETTETEENSEQAGTLAGDSSGETAAPSETRSDGQKQKEQPNVSNVSRPPDECVSNWEQFCVLAARYLTILQRDRINLMLLLLQAIIGGALIVAVAPPGVFSWALSPLEGQRIIFLIAIAAVLFGANNAAREICKERAIYRRERLMRVGVVPYVLSKVAVLAILCLAQSLILIMLLLPVTGLPSDGALLPGWLELLVTIWLTALGGVAMGLLISALVMRTERAISLVPLVLVPQIVLAGLIFPLSGSAAVLSSVTVSRWAVESLGTTIHLNSIYYQVIASAPPGIQPVTVGDPTATFNPAFYDAPAADRSAYTDAAYRRSRQQHLLSRWLILGGLVGLFLLLTCYAQYVKR